MMKDFVLDYNKKLGSIREVLSETISEAWDSENDILSINMEPFDTTHVAGMIKTENIQLNKVLAVFAVLTNEMRELKQTAETKYYGPLAMFGHIITTSSDSSSSSSPPLPKLPKVSMERQMGDYLPFLQDLCNFLTRANTVVRNTVAQLACLYHERMKLWVTTFKSVEFDCVYESMAALLTALVTIDSIIQSNTELTQAWAAYKRMMKYARADPERYGITGGRLAVLEQLLMNIDSKVMSATAFGALLTQDYSLPDPTATANSGATAAPLPAAAQAAALAVVAGNRVFSQAFNEAIARFMLRLKAGLGEEMETYERVKFVDLTALYALYRAVFKSTVKLDPKLFKLLWEFQTKSTLCVRNKRKNVFYDVCRIVVVFPSNLTLFLFYACFSRQYCSPNRGFARPRCVVHRRLLGDLRTCARVSVAEAGGERRGGVAPRVPGDAG